MKFLPVLVVLSVLVEECRGVCSDSTLIYNNQKQCFALVPNADNKDLGELQNAVQSDPQFVCRAPDKYKKAYSCALSIAKNCITEVGASTDVLPDEEKVLAGIDYVCSHLDKIDSSCVETKQQGIEMCTNYKTDSETSYTNQESLNLTCRAFAITAECSKELLSPCSGQTADVVVTYTLNFAAPTTCKLDTTSLAGQLKATCLAVLLAAASAFLALC